MLSTKSSHPITVDNKKYRYAVSLSNKNLPGYVIVDDRINTPVLVFLDEVKFPEDFKHSSWRGKHRDCWVGKREVEFIIKKYICQSQDGPKKT